MLGRELVATDRGRQPRRARPEHAHRTSAMHGNGVPVHINTRWVEADLRITTGFVEPHFFAGFSGGPKLVTPGLAGLDTVLVLHDATRIGDPQATWGITQGNPVHDDIRAAANAAPPHFAFDVILNREQRVIEAFAGELQPMHDAACEAATKFAMRPVPEPVRRGGDEQLGLSARSEPLPGGEGHVGGGEGGQAGRADRVRGRVPRRVPRPRLLPRAARAARQPARVPAGDQAVRPRDAGPVAGADPIQHPGPRAGGPAHRPPVRRRAARGAPRADGRHRADGRGRGRRARRCACCPRARRRSPTWAEPPTARAAGSRRSGPRPGSSARPSPRSRSA